MHYEYLFHDYILNETSLIPYGFHKELERYIYEKPLKNPSFSLRVTLAETIFLAQVFDNDFGEEYLPFQRKNPTEALAIAIQEEVDEIIQDILMHCFSGNSLREIVLEYVHNTYQTEEEYPWEDDDTSCTLKTSKKQKWYGLLMKIPAKRLGIDEDHLVHVLNLKNTPDTIPEIIDHKNIFPAYHMNKKHWFTILLNNQITKEEVFRFIDQSYELVEYGTKNSN